MDFDKLKHKTAIIVFREAESSPIQTLKGQIVDISDKFLFINSYGNLSIINQKNVIKIKVKEGV